jgi:hypothetical protein
LPNSILKNLRPLATVAAMWSEDKGVDIASEDDKKAKKIIDFV